MQKKIMNNPLDVARETMEGFEAAYLGSAKKLTEHNALISTKKDDRIALLIGGGSGHEPLWGGFLGEGFADAVVCGDVFAAPGPEAILDAIKAANNGYGVIIVHCNYAGDNMNFQLAANMATEAGIETRTIRVWDDIATGSRLAQEGRRGLVGSIYVFKIAAAAIREGLSISEVERVACEARDHVRTLAVAVKPGSIPATGQPTFELSEDEIEIGMGSHGEAGVKRQKIVSADDLAKQMLDLLIADHQLRPNDEVAIMINNLGSSTFMELAIVNRKIVRVLDEKNIKINRIDIGTFLTTQEMAGFSITIFKLNQNSKHLLNIPASSLCMKISKVP